MPRDPRYDILFKPLQIGPVTAPNRFYPVPHCTGMGYARPQMLAAMRGVKAEGGWGVVSTEYCSIHPSSKDDPMPAATLWDDEDVRAAALMVENVHQHGALAASRSSTSSRMSRSSSIANSTRNRFWSLVPIVLRLRRGPRGARAASDVGIRCRFRAGRTRTC